MSCVMCHMSHVTCNNFFWDKAVKLVGGGSVITSGMPALKQLYFAGVQNLNVNKGANS